MMKYPKRLDTIFNKLYENNITPVIVGGYVRDKFLGIDSNDIDIELYGISSLDEVEKILEEFGDVNSVGKSFGVCKLLYEGLDLDFSLPREDTKITSGHQGFHINIDHHLDFKTAASRRDFTINAMGYDVKAKQLLDPFGGKEDIQNKKLRAVDNTKFAQDPLRVLRGVVFASRFEMKLESSLELICKEMIQNRLLDELPKERIFDEMKKLLLKSKKPSKGFYLLKKLGGFLYFQEFTALSAQAYESVLSAVDELKTCCSLDERTFIVLALAVLTSELTQAQTTNFLQRMTNEKKIIKKVLLLHEIDFSLESFNDYDLYLLSINIDIEFYSHYLHVTQKKDVQALYNRAKELHILHRPSPPLLEGKDLIRLGLQPSKEFSQILQKSYEAQLRYNFKDKDSVLQWLKKELLI